MSQSPGWIVSRPREEFLQKWKVKNIDPYLVDDEDNRVSISSLSPSTIYTNLLIVQEFVKECFGCGKKPKTRSVRREGNPPLEPFRTEIKCENCGYYAAANTSMEWSRPMIRIWGQALLKDQLEGEKKTPKWLENWYYENIGSDVEMEDDSEENGEGET